MVNRKSFGRNRKSWSGKQQFRPKAETYRKRYFRPKEHISAERRCFWPKWALYFGRKRGISAEISSFCRNFLSAERPNLAEMFRHLPKPKISAESRNKALSVDHYYIQGLKNDLNMLLSCFRSKTSVSQCRSKLLCCSLYKRCRTPLNTPFLYFLQLGNIDLSWSR